MTPKFQKRFSFNDVTNNSVLTASIEYILSIKRFDIPYINIDTYLFVFMEFILVFYQEIALIFMLYSFVFSILTIAYFRLFC